MSLKQENFIETGKKPVNRNGGIFKKPGKKAKKEQILTPKQQKYAEVFVTTGNERLAKKEAGYSPNTKLEHIRESTHLYQVVEEKQADLWDMFKQYAEEALETQVEIMRSDFASYKTKLDATNSILDRAGYKPVERKEVSGNVTGNISNTITLDLVQRARELMATKAKTIDVTHVL